jgi:hypothetical protein
VSHGVSLTRPSTVQMNGDLVIFGVLIAVFGIVGIRVGMLVAGRLDRMTKDEESDDGDD